VPNLVVGIFPNSDPAAIERALAAHDLDLSKLKVVTRGVDTEAAEDSSIDFVDVERAMEENSLSEDITRGTGVMGDSGGTSVPGIGGVLPTLADLTASEAYAGYFAGISIPDDEVQNFNEAVYDGRAVVAYANPADPAAAAAAFHAAGLLNVRTY